MKATTDLSKPGMDITGITLIAAVGAAFGAFVVFREKFAIPAVMKRQTGSTEPAFWTLYVVPQWIGVALVASVCLSVLAAFIHFVNPSIFSQTKMLKAIAGFLVVQNIAWILVLAAVLGTFIQFNVLSLILIPTARFLSMLPIWKLSGQFGPKGQSAGWIQAYVVCAGWDKGRPLLISEPDVKRLADQVLYKLSAPGDLSQNFAARPKSSREAAGNIALLGCVLESVHYAQRWSTPKWSELFAALDTINDNVHLFDPAGLLKCASGTAFADQLRGELATEMAVRLQPVPEDNYLAAAGPLAECWEVLATQKGSLLSMIPFLAPVFGGRIYWLERKLRSFTMLDVDGMQPQLLKLLLRWELLKHAPKPGVFALPFSKRLGWHLLQHSVLRPFPDEKEITFLDPGAKTLTKIACMRIFRSTINKVRAKKSKEAIAIDSTYPKAWDLYAAVDFVLWSWASNEAKRGTAEKWIGSAGWSWKFESDRASRTS